MKKLSRRVSDLGEFGLISLLAKRFPANRHVRKGIGDDTAVFSASKKHFWLFTTDQIIEGSDFKLGQARAEDIGWKAIASNVSDIAAMGGWPLFATVSLALPASCKVSFVDKLYKGIKRAAKSFRL